MKVNACCVVLSERSDAKNLAFFCSTGCSSPRGSDEAGNAGVKNTIGLVRRWLPKKTNLADIPDDKIIEIEAWLNNRQRKCLRFKTPLEVFN